MHPLNLKFRKPTKKEVLREAKNLLLVILGCFILAFASAAFLEPLNIISGGVLSIGILINSVVEPLIGFNVSDIVVAVTNVIFWLLGFLFLGAKFSLRTLLSTLLYPAFFSLLMRTGFMDMIGISSFVDKSGDAAYLLLAGLFGGFLTGAGVAVSFLGNGSTGGVDVLALILAKYLPVREDIWSFLIDATLIIAGVAYYQDILVCLIGILTAFCASLAIQFIYIRGNSAVIVDVITDHLEEIKNWVESELEHGTTIIPAIGGYSGKKRDILRVIVNKDEINSLRLKIADIDPHAFVSMTQAATIHGEGFKPLLTKGMKHYLVLKKKETAKKMDNEQESSSEGE